MNEINIHELREALSKMPRGLSLPSQEQVVNFLKQIGKTLLAGAIARLSKEAFKALLKQILG